MPHRIVLVVLSVLVGLSSELALGQSYDPARPGVSGWQSPAVDPAAAGSDASPVTPGTPVPPGPAATPQVTHAQVTKGSGTLPNDDGQVWREYDISPYTLRVQNTTAPEQMIVDWILRETGYEAWHSKPVGLLSADPRTLRVYHTPQMQAIVADIVDRFVNTAAQNHGFGLRVITVENPNWRARAFPLMQSIPTQSPGVQGWIMAREDAALLLSDLKQRTDYREHNAPQQLVTNGTSMVISNLRPKTYVKGVIRTDQTWPGYQPEMGQFDEGYSLELSPLLSLDTRTVDAVLKLKLTQVERMLSVQLEVPTPVAQNQRTECQVPQITMVQLHERFRWPTDRVLILSVGVVAKPGGDSPNVITDTIPMLKSYPRADALLMVESRGPNVSLPAAPTAGPAGYQPQSATLPGASYHGRY